MWHGTRWYTPYHRDMDDIARRRRNRSSATSKVFWILVWFILLMVFA
jgi:hypothetical protein